MLIRDQAGTEIQTVPTKDDYHEKNYLKSTLALAIISIGLISLPAHALQISFSGSSNVGNLNSVVGNDGIGDTWQTVLPRHSHSTPVIVVFIIEGTVAMIIQASIALFMDQFVATLSNGQRVERSGVHKMADALHRAGVPASAVNYEWRAGLQMITAGQQVALRAAIRLREEQSIRLSVAA